MALSLSQQALLMLHGSQCAAHPAAQAYLLWYEDEKLGPGWAFAPPLSNFLNYGDDNTWDDEHQAHVSHMLPAGCAANSLA